MRFEQRAAAAALLLSTALGCAADSSDHDPAASSVEAITCGRTTCALANATPTCARGRCVIARCDMYRGDCNHVDADGCEVNIGTDVDNCGGCGTVCPSRPNTTRTCSAGVCGFTCDRGYVDCDGVAANGCEVNTGTDVNNCGGCGLSCRAGPFGDAAACCAGVCTPVGSDPSNCGACGTVCPAGANSTSSCLAGTCGFACTAGFVDCDGNRANGCESAVASDPTNCGACGVVCAAGESCIGGRCGVLTLNVALTWSVAADMDLHVVTPSGFEITYASRTGDGGTLDVDVTNGVGPENAYWVSTPPSGTYLVCAVPYRIPSATNFTVTVTNGGAAVATFTGAYPISSSGPTPCSRTSPYFAGEFTL